MDLNIPRPSPRSDGEYATYADIGYGKPWATIHLAEGNSLDLTHVTVEDCDRLIRAAARVKEQLLGYQAKAAAPHGRANLYQGTCQLCGKPEADELHAAPGAPHMCACGHFEAYHVGAVLGDASPGQCTDGDDCECQRYVIAAGVAEPEPADDGADEGGPMDDDAELRRADAIREGHSGRHPDVDRQHREAMATLSAGGHTGNGLRAMLDAEPERPVLEVAHAGPCARARASDGLPCHKLAHVAGRHEGWEADGAFQAWTDDECAPVEPSAVTS